MKRLWVVISVIAAIMLGTCFAVDAPPMMYPIMLGICAVVVFIMAPLFKQADNLLSEGKIITRKANFVETAHIFTISKTSIEDIIAALKNEGLPFAGLEWKTTDVAMGFWYNGWSAQMVKGDDDGSRDKFKFSFTQWQAMRHGAAVNITQMNQLLTAIEKAFLKVDPSAKVLTERIKIQTKSSFF